MGTLKDKIKEMEKEEIINALGECNWVMAKAARKLGITERMIGYKIRKYGIRKGAGDQPVNEELKRGPQLSLLPHKKGEKKG